MLTKNNVIIEYFVQNYALIVHLIHSEPFFHENYGIQYF